MTRQLIVVAVSAGIVLGQGGLTHGQSPAPIFAREQLAPHGLVRAFFTQVQIDPSRYRLTELVLDGDLLLIQTDAGTVHAVDSETGVTRWTRRIGDPRHPTLRAAVNKKWVAVINGSTLFILDRNDGRVLWSVRTEGAPGAGPALSSQRVYVPCLDGKVFAYRIDQIVARAAEDVTVRAIRVLEAGSPLALKTTPQRVVPLVSHSFGAAIIQPILTHEEKGEERVAWGTDRGFLFLGVINRIRAEEFPFIYRVDAAGGIVAQPTYLRPDPALGRKVGILFVVSGRGFVYAVRERDGKSIWRFSVGEPIYEPVAALGDDVFVTSALGRLSCLSAANGTEKWVASGFKRFVAASRDRVYAVDLLDQLQILLRSTGARVGSVDVSPLPIRMMNDQTDRIYLATPWGLVQCLREESLADPIRHQPDASSSGSDTTTPPTSPEAKPTP
ncbi:MAG: PQQ-like beta-propeller repeat protein [Thermoguttaceae bacterium]|nr:PQQ-like beta-propeller repeat protein [Thermoguttaceae bacterium]MDW8078161.1 PQQ-binding-like beta-propeller repeat protein [Thermoguttaceae bacterium]